MNTLSVDAGLVNEVAISPDCIFSLTEACLIKANINTPDINKY